MCDPVVFHGITLELWASIETQVRAAGIDVEHDEGTAHVGPTEISWNHDPALQTLTVQCLKKPFPIPCGIVNGKIQELFHRTCAAHGNVK